MLRKQTVWLLTMLTLMVVLSVYYLFNGSGNPDYASLNDLTLTMGNEEGNQSAEEKDGANDEATEDSMTKSGEEDEEWIDTVSQLNDLTEADITFEEDTNSLDFFVAYRLERDEQRAAKLEEYQNMMNRADATAQTIAEAQSKIEALWDQEEVEYTLENLLKEEGYKEALIMHTPNGGISVLVDSEEALDRKEVLNIIHLVRKHSGIPGNMITVKYR